MTHQIIIENLQNELVIQKDQPRVVIEEQNVSLAVDTNDPHSLVLQEQNASLVLEQDQEAVTIQETAREVIEIAPSAYSLPIATTTILGGVKSGGDISVNPMTGVVTVNQISGAPIDAETLDGLDSSDFALSNHTHAISEVQNLQVDLDGKLAKADNLSDLNSIVTARSNLGLGGLAVMNDLSAFDTDDLSEGGNLYYSDARARQALSATSPVVYNSSNGEISLNAGALSHSSFSGLGNDDHPHYMRADGTRSFSGVVSGITPTQTSHLVTKGYVDALVQGVDWQESVLDKDLAAAPMSPSAGDRYVIAGTGGEWSTGAVNDIAEWNGSSWVFTTPNEGFQTWVEDENSNYVFNGTSWIQLGSTTDHGNLIGLNDDDHPQYHNDARAVSWLGTRSSSDLPEGSNLYYTNSRARQAISATTPLSYNNTNGIMSLATVPISLGGTGASDAAAARSNLGLAIGSNVQAHDNDLDGLSGLSTNGTVERIGAGNFQTYTVTGFGKNLVDDVDAAAGRTTLGLGSIATQDADDVTITGGQIDATEIGGSTRAAGFFTNVEGSDNALWQFDLTKKITIDHDDASTMSGTALQINTDVTAVSYGFGYDAIDVSINHSGNAGTIIGVDLDINSQATNVSPTIFGLQADIHTNGGGRGVCASIDSCGSGAAIAGTVNVSANNISITGKWAGYFDGAVRSTDDVVIDDRLMVGVSSTSYKAEINGNLRVASDLYLNSRLYHDGDTDTYLGFNNDYQDFYCGGQLMLRMLEGANDYVVFNENGAQIDFRIESDTRPYAFFMNGINGHVGINTAIPNFDFEVFGQMRASGEVGFGADPVTNIGCLVQRPSFGVGLRIQDSISEVTDFNTGSFVAYKPAGSANGFEITTYLTGGSWSGDGGDITLRPDNTELMRLDASSQNVGIGASAPSGKLEIEVGAAEAKTCLVLDQDDLDQAFIDFEASSSAGTIYPVSTAALSTYRGKLRIKINGVTRWVPFYD